MFSALKFVAAVVIVALLGGFLLTGILTSPQDGEVLPAAVTESPSPMTAEESLSGMVTEEVEPGVLRIVYDGVRDPDGAILAVGVDGSVWGLQGRGFFRLGGEYLEWPEGVHPDDFAAAPDGVLWVVTTVSAGSGEGSISSFDGNQWTKHRTVPVDALAGVEIAPDGTVWAWWPEPNDPDSTVVARYGPDGWQPLATDFPAASHQGRFPMVWDVLVGGTGDVWVWSSEDGQALAWLSRYVDDEWETSEFPFTRPEVGADGILRAWPQPPSRQAEDGAAMLDLDRMPPLFDISRPWMQFDGGSWQPFGPDDGVLKTLDRSRVAPDGSIWASASGDDSGLSHFDGEAWSHHLPDHGVIHFEFGPDSSVWVTAVSAGQVANYLITPEAVAE